MRIFKSSIILSMIFATAISLAACGEKVSEKNKEEVSVHTEIPDNKENDEKQQNKEDSYEQTLFDNSRVHTVNIDISKENWDDLLENYLDKTKYEADITIDGEKIKRVSFSTKGNSSLKFAENNRYSFKVNFGKFVDGQTYKGLDKLHLNNAFGDRAYMKDYISYEIFKNTGVKAPLLSYVWLTINGKDYGLYIAIEEIGESFLKRTSNGEGKLYKPKTENINDHIKGEDLVYTDDNIDSYTGIFNHDVTAVTEKDNLTVINDLKGLAQGDNLNDFIDTDEVIRYFAAHNFVLNYDSYTGVMIRNYHFYLNNGKLSMLPWDYNNSFGKLSSVDKDNYTSGELGKSITEPLKGSAEQMRPMWSWIVSDKKYKEQYYKVYDELLKDYFESGKCSKDIDDIYKMIRPFVEKDPTTNVTAEEFDNACDLLKNLTTYRAKAIRSQISEKGK